MIAATVEGMDAANALPQRHADDSLPELAAPAAGWYGKLPSLGDFASRRLDHDFIEAWDHWLAAGIAAWREREPTAWLERYLSSPSWRFALAPGVLAKGAPAWAGVLMPSVDRVGRYFPLTLAMPLPRLPAAESQAGALLSCLQCLDDLALDALDEDWSADQLEAELLKLGGPRAATPDLQEESMASPLATLLCELLPGQALWICSDAHGEPLPRVSSGLPLALEFESLLGALVRPPNASP